MSVLRQDGAVSQEDENDRFSWREVAESIKSPHVWLLAAVLFFNGMCESLRLTRAHFPHHPGVTLYGLA